MTFRYGAGWDTFSSMRSIRTPLVGALLAFALFAAACGGGTIDVAESPTTQASAGTEAPGGEAPANGGADDRDDAPDFTLSLQPEGEYTLSEAGKPVYMVFWAEW